MFELTEEQQAVCTSMRRFAQRELRWRARKLDTAPPGTVDWELLRKSCDFGLLSAHLPPHYGGTMDRLSAAIVRKNWPAGKPVWQRCWPRIAWRRLRWRSRGTRR